MLDHQRVTKAAAELASATAHWTEHCPAVAQRPVALFYSRFHQKKRVLELETQLGAMTRKIAALEKRAGELKSDVARLEALRRELRAEIVPYARGEIVRRADLQAFGGR